MPMSQYVSNLRAKVGTTVLEVPTVSVLTFDDRQRVLLVRHSDGNDWTTPGGMIEPYETPSDAALREMWEETGLLVELTQIIGVFGGELCASTYSNGDKISWVSTVFHAEPVRGQLKPDGEEILEVRYFERVELSAIRCKPHVRLFLDAGYSAQRRAHFQPATWQPPLP
ncbi:MAG: NUDIX domain-containing protein [Betaproteobacteria bacterium]|nr:MAG: NUDIX domain-containing protein [Betaproteobacteria bacterium]